MNAVFCLLAASLLLSTSVWGQASARNALQVLERHAGSTIAGNVVAVVGFHGAEQPIAWQILLLDTDDETPLREYIVQDQRVTGPNAIARGEGTDLPKTPVFLAAMKLDSPDVYQIADDQAIEAGVAFAKINYQLRWRGTDPEPTWMATLLTEDNREVGRVYIMSASGKVAFSQFGTG